jgi:hypothetical protein
MVASIGLVLGLPATAYCVAPAHAATHAAAPGSKLGGFNTGAVAAGARVVVSLPGIAPVGDATKGDFLQGSLPFATSAAGTGPSTSGLASPVWPGDVAANAGNDLQTFSPSIPDTLVHALNYPVVARSVYPAQVHVGRSGSYAAPGGSAANTGTATTQSASGGTRSTAVINNTSPLGSMSTSSPVAKALSTLKLPTLPRLGSRDRGAAGAPLIKIASSTAETTASVAAGSVLTKAQTEVDDIVVAGVIRIAAVSSIARAVTDGKHGRQHSNLHVGKVTVAGVPASIGPKGIRLKRKPAAGPDPIASVNQLLTQLDKSGFTIKTIAPTHKVHGKRAAATSGALQIGFIDKSPPNLQSLLPQVPVPSPNSVAVDVTLGASDVTADASGFLPTTPIGGTSSPPVSGAGSPPVSRGGGTTTGSLPPSDSVPGSGSQVGGQGSTGAEPVVAQQASATVLGIPIRVLWVVAALVIAFMASGLMLGYANWQLLRGRAT